MPKGDPRQLQICQFTRTQTGTGAHSYSPSSPKKHTNRKRHTHTPKDTSTFRHKCVPSHSYTHANYRGQTSGVCCQDIIKTKSQPPLGMTEFDQSKALFRVRITFQLLKLMNSLCWLMKSSAANEFDSVFVLFTAHSKNNIVTVPPYKSPAAARSEKEGNDFTVCLPSRHEKERVKDNQCSRIFGSFNSYSSPSVMTNVTCGSEQRISLSHML